MPSDLDRGLLSPVTVGFDDEVGDAAVLAALVAVEAALTRAWGDVGGVDAAVAEGVAGAVEAVGGSLDVERLAAAGVAGGNPVIPLVTGLRRGVGAPGAAWVHRGATSQDVLDSALVLVAARAAARVVERLREVERDLAVFVDTHADQVAVARTLTQHAVPTTWGARASGWLRGVRRARTRLEQAAGALPAQLGGAAGTLAAFVEHADAETAAALPAALAARLGLAAPEAPWHTQRWPVTELGDALVGVLDALGKPAADVANAVRTEVGELSTGAGGGSSAMPQKQNPVAAVLIRSAVLRGPQLAATLHTCAAVAVDERPDGAWHAEWPTLRELLRITLGATGHAAALVPGLVVDTAAVERNLHLTRGLVLSERLGIALRPRIGADRFTELITRAAAGEDLATLVADLDLTDVDVTDLLDPAAATGLAGRIARSATGTDTTEDTEGEPR